MHGVLDHSIISFIIWHLRLERAKLFGNKHVVCLITAKYKFHGITCILYGSFIVEISMCFLGYWEVYRDMMRLRDYSPTVCIPCADFLLPHQNPTLIIIRPSESILLYSDVTSFMSPFFLVLSCTCNMPLPIGKGEGRERPRLFEISCWVGIFRLEEAAGGTASGALLRATLLLHNLTDLHRGVEELGGAAVEADGLALVELALAVVGGDALFLARLLQTIHGLR